MSRPPAEPPWKCPKPVEFCQAEDDDLEAVEALVGLDHEFLGHFGVVVQPAVPTGKVLTQGRGAVAALVVDAEGTDVHQAPDAGEPHGFEDVDGSHDVDLDPGVGRFRDLGADQTRSVYHGVHAVLPGRVQQRGEIQNVSLDEGNVGSRQFSLEEFSVRLHVIEDQPGASSPSDLGEGRPDES